MHNVTIATSKSSRAKLFVRGTLVSAAFLGLLVAGCASATDEPSTTGDQAEMPKVEEGAIEPKRRANGDCCFYSCNRRPSDVGYSPLTTSHCADLARSQCSGNWGMRDAWWAPC